MGVIEYSDDGVTWYEQCGFGPLTWANAETKIISAIPTPATAALTSDWNEVLLDDPSQGVLNSSWNEFLMSDVASGILNSTWTEVLTTDASSINVNSNWLEVLCTIEEASATKARRIVMVT